MTASRLVFIETVDEAGPPRDATTYVVVDTAWTPGRGDRDDIVPVRPAIMRVLERDDLFNEALHRLDAWAQEVRLDEVMLVDGVTWWYRIRPFVWYAFHEAILWRRVIGEFERDRAAVELQVPAGRPLLEAAAQAVAATWGGSVVVAAATEQLPELETAAPQSASSTSAPAVARARGRMHLPARLLRRIRRALGRPAPASARRGMGGPDERLEVLDGRVRALAGRPGIVLSIAYPRVYQVVASGGAERNADPQLAPVLDRLSEQGVPILVVGLDLDHRRDADWATVVADASLLPASYLRVRWGRPEDGEIDSSDIAARLAGISVPLSIDGADLSGSVATAIARYLPGWLDSQRRLARQARRMIEELRPRALFLNHEGIRTPWLAAAKQRDVRVVAVQHGVIYPTHPVYRHARLSTIPLPDVTCLFGSYEREVLLEHGGYVPAEVAVTGSPRPDQDGVADASPADVDPPDRAAERATVRKELGVADGDRLLVVSTANTWIVRDAHVVDMVARTLGGPLPGVHLVFKQHPGEMDEGPFPTLLAGLAASGGYVVPPTSVVRDIDLYRLLRAADAHLGLHSTVLTDAVVAGTPNLISVGQAYGDLLGYVDAGVARPVRDAGDVLAALADPRPPDPGARAAFLARHFREGDAVGRIVAVILAAEGAAPGGIALRPARLADARRLLDWANDPATRAASFDRPPITWDGHVAWLGAVLADPDRRLWIADEAGIPVGQIRVDRAPDGLGVVSIGLAPAVRGRGLGRTVLRLGLAAATRELGIRRARAVVMGANLPSVRLFEGAGFAVVAGADGSGMPGAVVLEADLAGAAAEPA